MREHGLQQLRSNFNDSITLALCCVYILILFKHVHEISYFSKALRTSVGMVNFSIIYWSLIASGLCLCNMALYSGYNSQYSSYLNAFINTV